MKRRKTITIVLEDVHVPSFFLWKWSRKDYEKPVTLYLDDAEVQFRFKFDSFLHDDDKKPLPDRQWPMRGQIILRFAPPDAELLDGLENPSGPNGEKTAERIHQLYLATNKTLILYGRWVTKLPSIVEGTSDSYSDLFYPSGLASQIRVFWKEGSSKLKSFTLPEKKQSFRINPIFKSSNLLTPEKWGKIDNFCASKLDLSEEVKELVQIRSKVDWGTKRIPVIETAALMEVVIRNKVQNALKDKGVSKKKIEDTNDGAGFSILLNTLLPLILTKVELESNKKYLESLDALRKVRNKIMHENLPEEDIDLDVVREGLDASIKITRLIKK